MLPVSALVPKHGPRPFGRGPCRAIHVLEAEAQVCLGRPRGRRQGWRRGRWRQRRETNAQVGRKSTLSRTQRRIHPNAGPSGRGSRGRRKYRRRRWRRQRRETNAQVGRKSTLSRTQRRIHPNAGPSGRGSRGRRKYRRRRWRGQRRATDTEPEVPAAGSVPPYLVCQRASGTGQREGQRSGDSARDLQGRTYSRFRQQIVPSIGCWFWHDPPVGR